MEEVRALEVIKVGYWDNVHFCGQVTKIRCGSVIAYVRENVQLDTFGIPANCRLAIKRGQMPTGAVQVLELAVNKVDWESMSVIVANADGLNRKVIKNPRFSCRTAEEMLQRG